MTETEHMLSCLAEECAEVAQRVSKALRFGLKEIQPGQPLTNAQRICEEILDLYAVVELLEESGALRPRQWAVAHRAMEAKKEKVRKFMDYARKVGALT